MLREAFGLQVALKDGAIVEPCEVVVGSQKASASASSSAAALEKAKSNPEDSPLSQALSRQDLFTEISAIRLLVLQVRVTPLTNLWPLYAKLLLAVCLVV